MEYSGISIADGISSRPAFREKSFLQVKAWPMWILRNVLNFDV